MKGIRVTIQPTYEKGLLQGNPLLYKDSIQEGSRLEEGQVIDVYNKQGNFLGRGYYALQNKGIGWILTKNKNAQIDSSFFESKLKQAFQKRESFFRDEETTAFRLFNGEGDGIGGLTIDYFDEYLLIQWYSQGIYQFKEVIISALHNCLPFKGIYEKKRFDAKGMYVEDDDFVLGTRAEFPMSVKENGMKFSIDLNDGAMVGVFLDQKDVRKTIRDHYAKGKTVLNTFSYTGAFSVAAALGGSIKTTSVDLANRSREKTTINFELNNIEVQDQHIMVEDVFHYFKYAGKKNLKFDMVILDPPSFARSKKHTFSAAKDYTNLLKEAIHITEKQGIIVASTNCSTFDMKKFKSFIHDAFEKRTNQYQIVEEFGLPSDFQHLKNVKESNYLKVVFIKKLF